MIMKLAVPALLALSVITAAEKPRVFITESGANQLSGEATIAESKGTLNFTGATSSGEHRGDEGVHAAMPGGRRHLES